VHDGSTIADLLAPTAETCRYRTPCPTAAGEELAVCKLLQQLLGDSPVELGLVARPVCDACCRSFPPSPTVLNPIVASLIYDRLPKIASSRDATIVESLRNHAQRFLAVDAPDLGGENRPERQVSAAPRKALCDLLPPPRPRCGPAVEQWAVGVTTAPRRQPTLERCLDSLSKAGWPRPILFVDGSVRLSEEFHSLPCTFRHEPLGAWPNYYLALTELLMREPLADAYMLIQDDALFHDGENMRAYLEAALWPGSKPGIVSLYSAIPDPNLVDGWSCCAGGWRCGAVALVFPRQIAIELLLSESVLSHRWSNHEGGLAGIPDVIENWATSRAIPLYFPTPSLVQHIGAASTIWMGSYELTPSRYAACFAGDAVRDPGPCGGHPPASP
jgi:hypothetical protein